MGFPLFFFYFYNSFLYLYLYVYLLPLHVFSLFQSTFICIPPSLFLLQPFLDSMSFLGLLSFSMFDKQPLPGLPGKYTLNSAFSVYVCVSVCVPLHLCTLKLTPFYINFLTTTFASKFHLNVIKINKGQRDIRIPHNASSMSYCIMSGLHPDTTHAH